MQNSVQVVGKLWDICEVVSGTILGSLAQTPLWKGSCRSVVFVY
jgi:hypothetical protein